MVVLIDNLRFDQWKIIEQEIVTFPDRGGNIISSILPTATQYARNAMFAGMMPGEIQERYPSSGWMRMKREERMHMKRNCVGCR